MKRSALKHAGSVALVGASLAVFGLTAAHADQGKAEASEKITIPATADGILQAIDAKSAELSKTIDSGKLENVHHEAFAIRDLVAALPSHSTSLAADKLAKVKANVKFVATLAERLDATGDANDLSGTKQNYSKLAGVLASIHTNYAPAPQAFCVYETRHHRSGIDMPSRKPRKAMGDLGHLFIKEDALQTDHLRAQQPVRMTTDIEPGDGAEWTSVTVEQQSNLYHLLSQVLAYQVLGEAVEIGAPLGISAEMLQGILDVEGDRQPLHILDSGDARSELPPVIRFVNVDCGHALRSGRLHGRMRDLLEHLYPRLATGAICSIFDYSKPGWHDHLGVSCPGVCLDVDAFLADKPERITVLHGGLRAHAYFRKR